MAVFLKIIQISVKFTPLFMNPSTCLKTIRLCTGSLGVALIIKKFHTIRKFSVQKEMASSQV